MKVVNIGLLGLGTVGCGTVRVLQENHFPIKARAGCDIRITHALCRDVVKERDCNLDGIKLVADPAIILDNPEIDIVVEVIGGVTIAREMVLAAIDRHKHVVTANKALIAKYGNEIFAKAKSNGVAVGFEAAVAGGIPIIKVMREGLGGNRIESLAGIMNGTCNYILTHMRDSGRDFSQVLDDAKAKGYAEADPTLDIGGFDAADKLTILAALAFGVPLSLENCYIEGIDNIQQLDITFAKDLGFEVKSLAICSHQGEAVSLRVHPTLVPADAMIAKVNGVMNAILVQANAVGPTMYFGAGAGALPTASAVVADIVDVVRDMQVAPELRVPYLAFQTESLQPAVFMPITAIITSYYLRLTALDKPGVLAQVTNILAKHGISISKILQKDTNNPQRVPIVILTHKISEAAMQQALFEIEALPGITPPVQRIRVEEF